MNSPTAEYLGGVVIRLKLPSVSGKTRVHIITETDARALLKSIGEALAKLGSTR